MAVRVQARSGLRPDALAAIAGDVTRTILDGLLGGEAQVTYTQAPNGRLTAQSVR